MRNLIIVMTLLVSSGCSSTPSLTKMSGVGYKVSHCWGIEGQLQCSRLMNQTCPDGFMVLNHGSRADIFLCQ